MRKILLGTLVLCTLLGVAKAEDGKRLLLDERIIAETDNTVLKGQRRLCSGRWTRIRGPR